MKKVIILLALLALSVGTFSCGGGGAGSANVPPGENPGLPSVVQLLPSHNIAQTNAIITLHTKVLDGNGIPVPNTPVTFTNLSPIGVLSSTGANTDSSGLATVTLTSTTTGFSTVQAEVNTGAGQIRNRKTVYFAVNINLSPFMYLDVDGDDDGFYDEGSDYILFENSTDNQVLIRATVFNRFGQRAFGSVVTFGADFPYRIGSSTTCSDGSSACEVSFPQGNTATTDINGEAFILVRVDPLTIRNVTTILNVTASADNGAANMVTLQLQPVTISTVTVSAVPTVVVPGATSTVTAAVTLNTGAPAFDGTTVSFTTTCGSVTPFAQTTNGATTGVTFTAPSTEGTCTITATAGGASDSVDVLVTSALTVLPSTVSVVGATGGTVPFTIFGGVSPYTVTSSNPAITLSAIAADGTFTATVPAGTPAGSVTLTVRDSAGTTKDVTLTIAAAPAITVVPGSYSVPAGAGGAFDFIITGGAPGYIVTSSNPSAVYDLIAGDGVWNVAASGDTFTANVSTTACPGTTTLTVYDTAGGTKTATIVIVGSPIVISPTSATICETNAGCGALPGSQAFSITGGTPPYFTTSSASGVISSPGAGSSFTVNAIDGSIAADTTVTLTVTDSCGITKTANVLVIDDPLVP